MKSLKYITVILAACAAFLIAGHHAGLSFASKAEAQQSETGIDLDYAQWDRIAGRAEEAIDKARASTLALEALRAELDTWRDRFLEAQNVNRFAIESVKRQLEALGPAPEDAEEADIVSNQRRILNERLDELKIPVKTADIEYGRATGMINGIDRIIQERQAREVLSLGPSPVNPSNWPGAINALAGTVRQIGNEFVSAWGSPAQRAKTKENLPAMMVYLLAGLLLLSRSRKLCGRLSNAFADYMPASGKWLLDLTVSLGGMMILPYLGVLALVEAVYATGLVGLRSEQIISGIANPVFAFLLARWMGDILFNAGATSAFSLKTSDSKPQSGKLLATSTGLMIAAILFTESVATVSYWENSTRNVIAFPLVFLGCTFLWRLAALLGKLAPDGIDDRGGTGTLNRFTGIFAFIIKAMTVIIALSAAIGYFELALTLIAPLFGTLLLLGGLYVLQKLVIEIHVMVSGNRERSSQSLIPVLIGIFLVVLSIPVFALIWGSRTSDLLDLWSRMLDGGSVAGIRISPEIFLTFILVFATGYVVTRLIQNSLRNTILPKTKLDIGGRTAIVSGVGYVGIFLAAMIAISSAGVDLSSIAIIAGALSVGIGFGLQTIVSNFVSGIILLVERPISEGDWIEVGGVHGTVRNISVRATIIETFDRTDVIVPNADLVSGRLTNFTKGNTIGRVVVPVGVAYGTDTRKVEAILKEIADAHPIVEPNPNVVFKSFGDSSLDFEIRAILKDVNWILSVRSDLNHEIARRFDEEGIEIPFPQRDIWLRNSDAVPKPDENRDGKKR